MALAAVQFGFMLGGSIVIESVFAIPGMGFLAWQSIPRSAFPTVQAIVFLLAMVFLLINLTIDLLYAVLDPRIRYS